MKINAVIRANQGEQRITAKDNIYQISLKSEPVKNKANNELIKLLEKHFGRKVIKILGKRSREKTIELEE
jgi:uncharacterized protein (TIGR00251 family)